MPESTVEDAGAARLYSVARALTGALTAGQVAEAVFTHALAELGAVSVGLWLAEAGRLRLAGGTGLAAEVPGRLLSFPLDSDLPGAVAIRTGRPVVYRSLEERNRNWPQLENVSTISDGLAVLPLEARDRAIGCLHIGFSRSRGGQAGGGEGSGAGNGRRAAGIDDGADLLFLSRLAELCAAALDRAQMHDAERARHDFLLDASAAVADAGGFDDTLRELAKVAVPRLADLCLIDISDGPGRIRRAAAVHCDPAVAPLVAELADCYPPVSGGPHPASAAMATRRSHWAADMPEPFLRETTRDEHHFELVKALQFTSFMCVPLLAGTEVLGVMTLVSAGSGRRFDGPDLALAEDLATRVAAVVAAARRHEQEHELAHVLQRLLLPGELPAVTGLETAVRYLTAQAGAEAGGDFYDLVRLPSDRLGVAVGDVEGHDAAAAATMGQLRSATRALAGQCRTPGAVMDALRWSWDLLGFIRTATIVAGRVDPATGDAVLASAGHVPPLVVTAGGRAAFVPVDGSPPLGAPGGPAPDHHITLAPGDTLFFYTDGLVERRNGSIDRGLERLRATLDGSAGMPLEVLCDLVLARHASSGRSDDVAILAVRRG